MILSPTSFNLTLLMKITVGKTKIMLFNTSRIYDFQPEVQLPHTDSYLDVVEHTRLLGIQISTELKWAK